MMMRLSCFTLTSASNSGLVDASLVESLHLKCLGICTVGTDATDCRSAATDLRQQDFCHVLTALV